MKKILFIGVMILTSLAQAQESNSIVTDIKSSARIEKAIAYNDPQKLFELSFADIAQLIDQKDNYIATAKESTNKAWQALKKRFDIKDALRIAVGFNLLALAGWSSVHGYNLFLKPFLTTNDNKVMQDGETKGGPKQLEFNVKDDGIRLGAWTLMVGLFFSNGVSNIFKGLAKHDRLAKYYKALAVETSLHRWLAFIERKQHELSQFDQTKA